MKIAVGCGKRNYGKGWLHVDGAHFDHVKYHDIFLEEFKDREADLIYACHLIAYFDRQEIIHLLECWRRVLRLGGILRIATPDFETMAQLYFNGKIALSDIVGPLYGKWPIDGKLVYHKTCYDSIELTWLLEDAGFKDVEEYDWRKTSHADIDDHSQSFIPKMDKEHGILISLNLECRR